MLTTPGRSGHRIVAVTFLASLLAACSATPVLHEFPPPLAPDARPPSAVSYTLRETEPGSGDWLLRGEQGGTVGGFRWQRAFQDVDTANVAPDRSEDFRRDDRFQDGINQSDYLFRLGATSDSLRASSSFGTAPPRVTIFNAASGERVGEIELRTGFDAGFEGIWRDRSILWRGEFLPAGGIERDTPDGAIEDRYPAAQLLQWTGGSNAGLRIYSGRAVGGEPAAFGEALFDITAGRPLTRRELGDAVVLLFAIRALEQAAGEAKVLREH